MAKQVRPAANGYDALFNSGKPINLQEKVNKIYSNPNVKIPIVSQEAADIDYTLKGGELENYELAKSKYGEFNPIVLNPLGVLDERQSKLDAITNGTLQFGSRTATSFLGTVGGLITGTGQWLGSGIARGGDFRTSDFTMDYFSQGLNAFDEFIAKSAPVYQDPEDTRKWTEQLGDLDFWAGSFLPNLGFTAGAALGVYATAGMGTFGLEGKLAQLAGKGLQGTKLGATAGKIAQQGKLLSSNLGKLAKGFKTERTIGELSGTLGDDVARVLVEGTETATAGKSNFAKQVYGTMVSTVGESKFEAIGTYNEMKQQLLDKGYDEEIANEYAKRAANADFFLNTAILGISNYAQFGHLFGSGRTLKRSFGDFIKGNIAKGYVAETVDTQIGKLLKNAPKWAQTTARVTGAVGSAALGGIREGGEEWMQYMANKVSKNYSERALEGADTGFLGTIDAMTAAATEEFSNNNNLLTGEGFYGEAGENFFLGALMGALGMPVNLKGKFAGGIIGEYQQAKETRKLLDEKNRAVQDTVQRLESFRKKYGIDKLAEEIDPSGKMEAAELLVNLKEAMGKNKAFKDAMVSYSFQIDSTNAYEKGDMATGKLMDVMAFTHDLITAEEAGKAEEFLNFFESQDPIKAQEIRDFVKQQTKEGTADPLADLTDAELEKKVEDNKKRLVKTAKKVKEIHNRVKSIPNVTSEGAKQFTTLLAGASDIEERFQEMLQPGNELDKVIETLRPNPEEFEKSEKFQEFVNTFLNPQNIKQTLSNINNNLEDYDRFREEAANKLSSLMSQGVIDIQEATEAFKKIEDLARSARMRNDILQTFNRFVEDPKNFNENQNKKVQENEKYFRNKIGQEISKKFAAYNIDASDNILSLKQGKFFALSGEDVINIDIEDSKITITKNGEIIPITELYNLVMQENFIPLTEEQAAKYQELKELNKIREAEEAVLLDELNKKIAEVKKDIAKNEKAIENLLDKKKTLSSKIENYQKDLNILKTEIEKLVKTKNKFKKQDLPVLQELYSETQSLLDSVNTEINTIDSQIEELQKIDADLTSKVEFLNNDAFQNIINIELKEAINELKKLAVNSDVVITIKNLQDEKAMLLDLREDLENLFEELKTEEYLIKLYDSVERIDERLNEINNLLKELEKELYHKGLLAKIRLLDDVFNSTKKRLNDKVGKENKEYNSKNNTAPVQEEDENFEPYDESAKKPISFGFFTTTGNETIEGTDIIKLSEREQRWYGYLNRTSKKDLKKNKLLLFTKDSPYNDINKLGEDLYDSNIEDADIYALVTDKDGNPIEDNGKYIWTSIHLPTRAFEKFSYNKELTEEEKQAVYEQARNEFKLFREKVLEKIAKNEKPLVNIVDKSKGREKKEVKEGNNLLSATGYTIKDLPLEVAIGNDNIVQFPQSGKKDVPNGSTWTETNLGDPLFVAQNNLSQEDAEAVFELIKKILNGEKKSTEGVVYKDVLQKLIFIGNKNNKYSIYIAGNNLVIKGSPIDKVLLDSQKENIISFLRYKRYNVDKSQLDLDNKELKSNKTTKKFYKPIIKNGKLDFEEFTSYKQFLVEQALKVYAPNVGESESVNKYLQFAPIESKPSNKPKEVIKDFVVLDEESNEPNNTSTGIKEEKPVDIIPEQVQNEDWKSLKTEFNSKADGLEIARITSKKPETFLNALNVRLENSTNKDEIALVESILNKLENKNVEVTEKITTFEQPVGNKKDAIKDFYDAFDMSIEMGTPEQNEKGKEQQENCNN